MVWLGQVSLVIENWPNLYNSFHRRSGRRILYRRNQLTVETYIVKIVLLSQKTDRRNGHCPGVPESEYVRSCHVTHALSVNRYIVLLTANDANEKNSVKVVLQLVLNKHLPN